MHPGSCDSSATLKVYQFWLLQLALGFDCFSFLRVVLYSLFIYKEMEGEKMNSMSVNIPLHY